MRYVILGWDNTGHFSPLGRLVHLEKQDRIHIQLNCWRFGRFYGTTTMQDMPYVDGDILASIVKEDKVRAIKPISIWIGHVHTTQSSDGKAVTYWGELEVMPFKNPEKWDNGYWFNVARDDGSTPPNGNDGWIGGRGTNNG